MTDAVLNSPEPSNGDMAWGALAKLHPGLDRKTYGGLAVIWDAIIERVIRKMLSFEDTTALELHVNLREEMALELAKLQFFLAERVVQKRLGARHPSEIDVAVEREACLGEEGTAIITTTARNLYDRVWKKRMSERWLPKTKAALEREKNPVRKPLAVKPVANNHFIPRWFIKDYWSASDRITRWRRQPDGGWASACKGVGEWGYRRNLYSHHLEAYFSLIDGDANKPIRMLRAVEPLNAPQRDALIGFLVIQMLRSPFLIDALYRKTRDLMASTDEPWGNDTDMPQKAYEAIYRNNAFYDRCARPLLWSRWALVSSETPAFALPDTFCARGTAPDGGLRVIVPISPSCCFMTLLGQEDEKRIVPFNYVAPADLAQDIGAILAGAASRDFLSAPDFVPPALPRRRTAEQILAEVETEVVARDGRG